MTYDTKFRTAGIFFRRKDQLKFDPVLCTKIILVFLILKRTHLYILDTIVSIIGSHVSVYHYLEK